MLLTEQLAKKRRHEFRLVALAQGVDIDEDENEHEGEELPPEVLEAERKFKEEREKKRLAREAQGGNTAKFADGLGYEVVN